MELWLPIAGDWLRSYEVSNHGRVRTVDIYRTPLGRGIAPGLLTPASDHAGYRRVHLKKLYGVVQMGRHPSSMKKVSRLVAEAFVANDTPEVKVEVDHLDNNTGNDYYLNLEWVTTIEQQRRRVARMRLAGKTSSGYIGVSWHEKDKRWVAQIVVNNHRVFIGNFTRESHAARAYDDYVIDNHLFHPTNWNTELDR